MDNRKPWTFRGCTITPETGESRYFGHPDWTPDNNLPQYYTRWWRVNFPNKTYVLCSTKDSVYEYINTHGESRGGVLPKPWTDSTKVA